MVGSRAGSHLVYLGTSGCLADVFGDAVEIYGVYAGMLGVSRLESLGVIVSLLSSKLWRQSDGRMEKVGFRRLKEWSSCIKL